MGAEHGSLRETILKESIREALELFRLLHMVAGGKVGEGTRRLRAKLGGVSLGVEGSPRIPGPIEEGDTMSNDACSSNFSGEGI